MGNIIVVGSLNMDLVVRVSKMPRIGETIFGKEFLANPGGKGANQAIAAARLGGKVTMIGRVGCDSFGETLLNNLNVEGIDTSLMQFDKEIPTGIASIMVDKNGQNSIIVVSGANMRLLPDQVEVALEKISQISVMLLQLETPLETIKRAAIIARKHNATVILNPSPVNQLSGEVLNWVDILVPNEIEASQLTNQTLNNLIETEAAAHQLIQRGAKSIVVTLGEKGVLIVNNDSEVIHLEGHRVDPVDSTAAGDAFIGGLAVGLTEGFSLTEASKLGNAAGALTVTRPGAQSSLPNRHEVNEFLSLHF